MPKRRPVEEDDDIEGILEDAPDDLDDEDELVDWFAERLDVDDDTLSELAKAAAETAGILAAFALLELFSAGWDALDAAEDDATLATTEDIGPVLTERLSDIALDMADDLGERLDDGWGDEDGTEISGLAEINAQSEYSESKSDADQEAGWEYAQYLAEPDACDICADCHGTILPIDDPWWDDHEPDAHHPLCRCLKVPLSAADADARGGVVTQPPVGAGGSWKDKWPPDVSDHADVLQGIYHGKIEIPSTPQWYQGPIERNNRRN